MQKIDNAKGIAKNKEIAILLGLDDDVRMYDEFDLYSYHEFGIRYYNHHLHYTINFETEARRKSSISFIDMLFDSIGGLFNLTCGGSQKENTVEVRN